MLYFLELTRGELKEELNDIKACANNIKKIKESIESLTKNVSNTDTIIAQRFTQIKELFTRLTKNNLANLEVPTHGELCSICFCLVLNP